MSTTAINNLRVTEAKDVIKTLVRYVNEKDTHDGNIVAPDALTPDNFTVLNDNDKFEYIFKEITYLRESRDQLAEENRGLKADLSIAKEKMQRTDEKLATVDDKMGVIQHNTLRSMGDVVDLIGRDTDKIKVALNNQQSYLERCRSDSTKLNVVFAGVKTGPIQVDGNTAETPKEKVISVLAKIGVPVEETDFTMYDIPAPENRDTQFLKFAVKDMNLKKSIMEKKMSLKALPEGHPLKFVFIKNDEPVMTRKENERLRYRMRCIRREYPNDQVKIEKGKLYHNNNIVDTFNLDNQIF